MVLTINNKFLHEPICRGPRTEVVQHITLIIISAVAHAQKSFNTLPLSSDLPWPMYRSRSAHYPYHPICRGPCTEVVQHITLIILSAVAHVQKSFNTLPLSSNGRWHSYISRTLGGLSTSPQMYTNCLKFR